jgi:hypothetical protein
VQRDHQPVPGLAALPFDLLPLAPRKIKEALLAAFDIHALYHNDTDQVTVWATITNDTPRTIAALLDDPRTDHDTWHGIAPSPDADPAQPAISELGQGIPVLHIHHEARIHHANVTGAAAATGGAAAETPPRTIPWAGTGNLTSSRL